MEIRHMLFDLDGTLLPMIQEEFIKYYMPLLAKSYLEHGAKIVPKDFIALVWAGYEAMVKNDGSRTNREAFWGHMKGSLPLSQEKSEEIALQFYETEFNKAVCMTRPSSVADKIVKEARGKNIKTYLATNPVFPRCATLNRIRWAGLDANDFEIITTYEECRFCKPSIEYFSNIIRQFNLDPKECLMVGNDVSEDLVVRDLGVKTYLVTDTMENRRNLPLKTDYKGSLEDLLKFVENL